MVIALDGQDAEKASQLMPTVISRV